MDDIHEPTPDGGYSPDEVLEMFHTHWSGTEEELHEALHAYYRDIRSSFVLALNDPRDATDPAVIVDDYVTNHYDYLS